MFRQRLFYFFPFFQAICAICSNSTTHKADLCDFAVDNPDLAFSEVDKNANGLIEDSEYKEGCEIGYQEEQFCNLDIHEPFGLLDLEEYVTFKAVDILPFFRSFDKNNDSVFDETEIDTILSQFSID